MLNNLAARAMEDTKASIVAIGVEREGAMMCRAVAGLPLTDPGAPINTDSGLTGMAIRLQMSQWCTDTESDARVDVEVCRQLGLRSIIVVPMRSGDTVIGIFAIFSATPDAFSLADLKTVKKLAHWATEALEATAVKLAGPALAGLDYSEEKQAISVDWPGGTESYLARLRRTMARALNPLRSVFRHRSMPP
ncbi:MAG: GAF domain-containing protein [Terriglobales bacterium]